MLGSNNTSTALRNSTEATISTQDVVFASLYSLIVLFGVIGNSIVITIIHKTKLSHTTTNYLLMNLALADLLTLLFCPGLYDYALQNVHLHGFSGDLICKLFAGNAVSFQSPSTQPFLRSARLLWKGIWRFSNLFTLI